MGNLVWVSEDYFHEKLELHCRQIQVQVGACCKQQKLQWNDYYMPPEMYEMQVPQSNTGKRF